VPYSPCPESDTDGTPSESSPTERRVASKSEAEIRAEWRNAAMQEHQDREAKEREMRLEQTS
jgi:hypothetical protein